MSPPFVVSFCTYQASSRGSLIGGVTVVSVVNRP